MADIATLGLAVDSRQVVSAKAALDNLTASARPAAAAAAQLEKAGQAASRGAGALVKSGQLARHEMINLSRQLQDVGVSLASGQSPFIVLTQQGAQIADIFGSSKTGSVGGAFKQIVNFIGPVRLLALGVGGVAAAAAMLTISAGNSAKQFDDLANSVGASTRELRGFQTAAGYKGIAGEDFGKAFAKWGDDIYKAKNGMGGLAEVFRANNVQAKTFNDFLFGAADLIKNAKDDQQRLQLLQQMGLPATMQWVGYLKQGSDALKLAAEKTGDFSADAEKNLIRRAREFDDAWNVATTNISNKFKSWTLSAAAGISGLIEGMQKLSRNTWGTGGDQGIALPKGKDTLWRTGYDWGGEGQKKTVDPAVVARNISLQQQQLAIYGQTITALEAVKQVELQVQQARLNGVTVDERRVAVLKRLAIEQTIGVTAIKAQTDAIKIDAATVGMSVGEATQYAAAQNAINEARRQGRELTPQNIEQIQREAAALGQAASNADLLRFSYTNLVQGPLQTFTSTIASGAGAWDAFKKAGQSALNSIASKLMEIAAQNLWKSAFGGGGGFLPSLFGSTGIGETSAVAGASSGMMGGVSFPMLPAYADGTNYAPGGWSVVGEKGPELMNVPRGAQILPNGVVPNASGNVTASVIVNVDATGADPAGIARMAAALETLKAEIPHRVVAAVNDAKRKRQL